MDDVTAYAVPRLVYRIATHRRPDVPGHDFVVVETHAALEAHVDAGWRLEPDMDHWHGRVAAPVRVEPKAKGRKGSV